MLRYFGARYVDAASFANEVRRLRIYRTYVGESLLERLERARLVVPKLRILYPDPITRRWWHEEHPDYSRPFGQLEPDGPRYEAAVQLVNALYRHQHQDMYGRSLHPLDDPDPAFEEFVHKPAERSFVPWRDLCVDVSNETHSPLYDSRWVTTMYSSWQLLVAAEVADMGVHYLFNLAEEETYHRVLEEARLGGLISADSWTVHFEPIRSCRSFFQHEHALDALVWFIEETNQNLSLIVRAQPSRYRLDEEQRTQYITERDQTAKVAAERYCIGFDDLIALSCFLADRWADWSHDGRPLIADEYKRYLGHALLMSRIIGDRSYEEMRELVGARGGYFGPVLDQIFPNWGEIERNRARRALKAMIQDSNGPRLEVTEEDADSFVEFLDRENLHSFFWRLRSFEEHLFRGNEFSSTAMRSEIQGMAVVVEHVMRALGGARDQIDEMFKEIWTDTAVRAMLKRSDISGLARRRALDWKSFMRRIDRLRCGDATSRLVADLVLTSRIRRAVHRELPESDPWRWKICARLWSELRCARLPISAAWRRPPAAAPLPSAPRSAVLMRDKQGGETLPENPPRSKKPIDFLSLVTAPTEAISATGVSLSNATSFFYKKTEESVYLVTNWHVVTGRHTTSPKISKTGAVPTTLRLKMHKNIGDRISLSQKLQVDVDINDKDGSTPEWLEHPLHKYKVDIAVVKINPVEELTTKIRFHCLQEWKELESNFFPSVMDDAFVVGYPWGLTGGDRVLPLYKRGSVASEPSLDYNNLPCFLIDCRTARAMSGSPVVCSHSGIWSPTGKWDGNSTIGTVMNFAGVYSGRLIDPDPGRDTRLADQIAEIGIVWKKEALDEIIEHGVVGTKLSELE